MQGQHPRMLVSQKRDVAEKRAARVDKTQGPFKEVIDLFAHLTHCSEQFGITNPNLTAGLEARGAIVDPIRVYEWGLPEDPALLIESLQQLASGASNVVLFTSANQVRNLLTVADDLGIEEKRINAERWW